jgi:NTE family protein
MLALFEAGIEAPAALVGTSVGALNATAIGAFPSLAGVQLLRQVWRSPMTRRVYQAHPIGILYSRLRGRQFSALPARNVLQLIEWQTQMIGVHQFEDVKVPLSVVATDLGAGRPYVFNSGPLLPALQASTAIPGIFPAVHIDGRHYVDGGIVDNTPISVAVSQGAKDVLAVGLMAGGELEKVPGTWGALMARTLQLSLHHQMLRDFERLKGRGHIVVLCPISPPAEGWDLREQHVEAVIERSRESMATLLSLRGSKLFRESAVHYLGI